MSIQSNINQMLSIAGLLISQNPTIKAAAEKKSQNEALKKRDVEIEKALAVSKGKDRKLYHELTGELSQIRKKEFLADPTTESLGAYKDISKELSRLEKASKSASDHLKSKQNERRSGKEVINIMSQPTSLGETVGNLDPKLADLIKKQLGENNNG